MKTIAVLLLLALLPASVSAAQKASVEELRQALAALQGKSDRQAANRISALELTERLSRDEFEIFSRSLPGQKSRTALLAVADASIFRDPPPRQMLPDPAPDAKAQREIIMRAVQFANDQAERLPSFEALRSVEHFQDSRVYPYSNKIEYYTPGSFRLLDHRADDMRYWAGGEEMVETVDRDLDRRMSRVAQPLFGMTPFGYQVVWGNLTWNIPNLAPAGLKPTGAFGPWLQAVTGDLPDSKHDWGYWEAAPTGKLAVFRFRIAGDDSHFTIESNYEPNPQDPFISHTVQETIKNPGYYGEIAVDPVSGQVARIVVTCDLPPGETLSGARIALDYGPVQMDGETFILPVRGVSRSSLAMKTHNYYFDGGSMPGEQSDHFTVTSLDDLAFSEYRPYKPRVKIVPLKSLDTPGGK